MSIELPDRFEQRHTGPDEKQRADMLRVVGMPSLDALIDAALPQSIRLKKPLRLPPAEAEHEYLDRLRTIAQGNQRFKSFIGMGYSGTITPSVILRNLLENPSWYTPYTPYQAEIAQGRLEALLNFQTMVRDLTAMEIATASLLDEATAAAEAMTLLHRVQMRQPAVSRDTFWVSDACFPQTLDVLRGRAEPLGIRIVTGDPSAPKFAADVFGAFVQSPDDHGAVLDLRAFISAAHNSDSLVAVATDLLSLALIVPPGDMGADVVVGSAQRFGVPLGYGGPHAAFLATREAFVRQAPGRIIGVSVDAHGNMAYRMALQTREQHIRREKATSNICTAQALLANIAGMYAVYHGPEGLAAIATRVHELAGRLEHHLGDLGYRQQNAAYFDTLRIEIPEGLNQTADGVRSLAERAGLNFRYFDQRHIGIALDETTSAQEVGAIARVFAEAAGKRAPEATVKPSGRIPAELARRTPFLTHPVFSAHRSETKMMRYLKRLERKDIGLDRSMIPLGSCTMKLNAASEMIPVTWPEFSAIHPFTPVGQLRGYAQIIRELEEALAEITGFKAVSLQPNSGAQGELTGLMVIRAYHHSRGDSARDVVLIPSSAHGTNPASAVMAGLKVVVVASDAHGNVDVADLKAKAAQHGDRLAALMVTYPSTHGVFEDAIQQICGVIHQFGGQVYMDGANMNAQVGLTSPATIGADVCHLNLHKTFAIPHGGGGPGMGPIAAAAHLAPFLPGHPVIRVGGPQAIHAVSAAPWGSASILLISYGYIRMLGAEGMTNATKHAILNANYIKRRLEPHYDVLYTRPNGVVAHEMIFDLRRFKRAGPASIDELDVAKRLMDYGFHAPTVSFPVAGTLMIEPTESESQEELDRFCEAMIAIRQEIQAVVDGKADPRDNVLKNAPHTAAAVAGDQWTHPYSRAQAAFPLPYVRADKFWPPVGRIDNAYGDRNLICTCPDTAEYAETES
jgi:glycine cleavage system P protein (glycine dehydrogenase)